jgi:hypothetical protein
MAVTFVGTSGAGCCWLVLQAFCVQRQWGPWCGSQQWLLSEWFLGGVVWCGVWCVVPYACGCCRSCCNGGQLVCGPVRHGGGVAPGVTSDLQWV